jgi:hypothetical protein
MPLDGLSDARLTLGITVDNSLLQFSLRLTNAWAEADVDLLSRLLFPNPSEPLRPHFNIIPNPPPWAVVHNIDAIRQGLPHMLFRDAERASILALGIVGNAHRNLPGRNDRCLRSCDYGSRVWVGTGRWA